MIRPLLLHGEDSNVLNRDGSNKQTTLEVAKYHREWAINLALVQR